jgi:hypothetical protein
MVVMLAGAANCLALARPNHLESNTSMVPSLFIALKVVLRAVARVVFVVRYPISTVCGVPRICVQATPG